MAVPEGKRTESKLAFQTKAIELADYTTTICNNNKIFPKRDRWMITNRIIDKVVTILECTYEANDVYVSAKEDYMERRELQKKARQATSSLLALMALAYEKYPIGSKKMEHWTKLVKEERSLILKWMKSDKEYLKYCLVEINEQVKDMGLTLNAKKTQIHKLEQGINFLGFKFVLTDTGKVLKLISKENIKKRKRKLRKYKKLVSEGRMTKEKADECYIAWKAHVKKGDSYLLLQKMDKYYEELWRG